MKTDKHMDDKRIRCPECGSDVVYPTNTSIMGRNLECLACGLEFAIKIAAVPEPPEEEFKDD